MCLVTKRPIRQPFVMGHRRVYMERGRGSKEGSQQNKQNKQNKGWAKVTFATVDDAQAAKTNLDGAKLNGFEMGISEVSIIVIIDLFLKWRKVKWLSEKWTQSYVSEKTRGSICARNAKNVFFLDTPSPLKDFLIFVLIISWLRERFQINFPTQFIKSEISRAQRGKFDFVN